MQEASRFDEPQDVLIAFYRIARAYVRFFFKLSPTDMDAMTEKQLIEAWNDLQYMREKLPAQFIKEYQNG